ncbi:InlB B-repeat-containing protein [Treponema vincentii]|uniref:InlB B-repeat-containing protein n=1 Tax=Treponema vincentii TaxID=69710 RepID=UPI001BAF451C|nr:InlB B-repeat-containing protein [Treponema vincentii]QUY18708.1 InlB B-repeat-containing protein [Treponema vincentii]
MSVNGETKSDTSITVKADKDLTVTVKFKAADTVTYTVTFDAQGGSAVAPIQAGQGKTIAQPADPAKDGFTFGGWYKESACTTPWNFATDTVTADITLYAKWTAVAPATVTVTFAVKGGHGTLTAKAGDTNLTSGASVKKKVRMLPLQPPRIPATKLIIY